jgi:hypothetical protein
MRGAVSVAADDDRFYLSVRARSDWLTNAFGLGDVDIVNCLPKHPQQKESNAPFAMNSVESSPVAKISISRLVEF